jgi:hypothetical protein
MGTSRVQSINHIVNLKPNLHECGFKSQKTIYSRAEVLENNTDTLVTTMITPVEQLDLGRGRFYPPNELVN